MRKSARIGILGIVLLSFLLFGCSKKNEVISVPYGTTCANIQMGNGRFAYGKDYLYYAGIGQIIEYDMRTGKVILLPAADGGIPSGLYLNGEYVCYTDGAAKAVRLDGKKEIDQFTRQGNCIRLYVEGQEAWYMDYVEENLYYRNLLSGEERKIATGVLSYFVSEDLLYVVIKQNDVRRLYCADRQGTQLEAVDLAFEPISVLVAGKTLYLAEKGSYQIHKLEQQVDMVIPVCGTYYQVLGDWLIYSDSTGFSEGYFPLKAFNTVTEESRLITDWVFDFCVLEERYVCYDSREGAVAYYDWEKGNTVTVFPNE